MKMAGCILVNGKIIKEMVKVRENGQMIAIIMVIGNKINVKDMVKSYGKMDQLI